MGLDMIWIPETGYRGISDREVVDLANSSERVILTRDSDFLRVNLRRRVRYGLLYIAEPIRKDNVEKLARNIAKTLEVLEDKPILAIVSSSTIELYPLTL
ncbi:MAG: DUF5615 family PIN-like protein [Desulfurococcales archaeon]|nr:DUF5615 family PIN-like protein [Desulfurococcales archaeon]